jgi:hypothetical protein
MGPDRQIQGKGFETKPSGDIGGGSDIGRRGHLSNENTRRDQVHDTVAVGVLQRKPGSEHTLQSWPWRGIDLRGCEAASL